MSYFELQANFWKLDNQQGFTGNETRLYFYLLYLFNQERWAERLYYSNQRLMVELGISMNGFKSARAKLKEAGLIDYESGGQCRKRTAYQIMTPKPTSQPTPYNNKSKDSKTNIYGNKKGFVVSGSDFD